MMTEAQELLVECRQGVRKWMMIMAFLWAEIYCVSELDCKILQMWSGLDQYFKFINFVFLVQKPFGRVLLLLSILLISFLQCLFVKKQNILLKL